MLIEQRKNVAVSKIQFGEVRRREQNITWPVYSRVVRRDAVSRNVYVEYQKHLSIDQINWMKCNRRRN